MRIIFGSAPLFGSGVGDCTKMAAGYAPSDEGESMYMCLICIEASKKMREQLSTEYWMREPLRERRAINILAVYLSWRGL